MDTLLTNEAKRVKEPSAIGIGMLGMGVVGSGVARVLLEKGERLASIVGRPLSLKGVLLRDPGKRRPFEVPSHLITTDVEAILNNPEVDICLLYTSDAADE